MSELEVEIESVRIALDNIANSSECEYNRRQRKSLWRRLEELQKVLAAQRDDQNPNFGSEAEHGT
jgi:hypothetical protein